MDESSERLADVAARGRGVPNPEMSGLSFLFSRLPAETWPSLRTKCLQLSKSTSTLIMPQTRYNHDLARSEPALTYGDSSRKASTLNKNSGLEWRIYIDRGNALAAGSTEPMGVF